MTNEQATALIKIYGEAWEKQDADLILTVFTPNATYLDPREGVQGGHEGIRAYWESKVITSQKDIHFNLLHVWVDGNTVIAEWNALFIDTVRNLKIDMIEVAIFEAEGEKFSSLREYYRSVKTPME
jgi:uncharacterized protein (TIGR02246 family)